MKNRAAAAAEPRRPAAREDTAIAYNVRPLSFGEVLDRGFQVLRDNLVVLAGISAVVWVPYALLDKSRLFGPRATPLVALLLLLIAGPIIDAALVIAVSNLYLGRPTSIGGAYRSTTPIISGLLGTIFLKYLLIVVAAIPFGVLIGLTTAGLHGSRALAVALAMLLAFPVSVYFATCWVLVTAVIVVENVFGMVALTRSRTLVKGVWWRTWGVLLVAGLIAGIPSLALQFIWGFIPLFGPVLSALTSSITGAYSSVVIVVYYFDRRCRTEAFDLRLLAEQIRAETAAQAALAGAAPGA